MADDRKTLAAIDGTNRIYVFWHATRGNAEDTRRQFVNELLAFRAYGFGRVVVAVDSGPSFRSRLYSEYKANRDKRPAELVACVEACEEAAFCSGFPVLGEHGFEADDILATLAARVPNYHGWRVVLATPDKDCRQCLREGVVSILRKWRRDRGALKPEEFLTAAGLAAETGLQPEQWADAQALAGDSGDNVPGVEGVGLATAAKWLAVRSLDEIVTVRGAVKMSEKQWRSASEFAARREELRQLTRLRDNVPGVVAWARGLA